MPGVHTAAANGNGASTKPRKVKPSLAPIPAAQAATDNGDCSFARALASPDPATRHRGLSALCLWLQARPDVGEGDMRKIWKGLFYCYWHADLAPVQADLAQRLADLPASLPPHTASLYLSTGLATLQREWGGLDRLRMDKFMGLARRLVRAAFAAAAKARWEAGATAAALRPLGAALVPDTGAVAAAPAGLGLHIADVAASELVAVATDRDEPGASSSPHGKKAAAAAAGWAAAAAPFVAAAAGTPRPELAARLGGTFFRRLAAHLSERGAGGSAGAAAIADACRAAAGEPATRARNRGTLCAAADALDAAAGEAAAEKAAPASPAKPAAVVATPAAGPGTPPGPGRRPAPAPQAPPPPPPPTRKRPSPPPPAEAPPPSAADAGGPKRVKWALRSNIAHAVGAPVPPPAVRTPPGSRPRGPALAPRARSTRLGRDGTPAAGPGKAGKAAKAALFR